MSTENPGQGSLRRPLIGHAQPVQAFASAVESGRLHHAWLLHGPKGVGKATFARRASAWMLAPQARAKGGSLAFDTHAEAFGLIESGAHPDAAWLDLDTGSDGKRRPTTIPVAQVRKVLASLTNTPAAGGWRTMVLDSVDDLNREGANALLKPLEEPPRKTVLFLVAHSLSAVLPTIRSRCRHLAFSPLEIEDINKFAAGWTELSGEAVPQLAMDLADGRPGLLVSLQANQDALELFTRFTQLASGAANLSDRLALASRINQTKGEGRTVLLSLIDDWLSRRVRGFGEPAGLYAPAGQLSHRARSDIATLWSNNSEALHIRQAINLDITERVMTLFAGIDQVYSIPTA
ncbi:MAG: hypothetical protein AAF739_12890 [Pseudomonadota bacterium]